MFEMDYLLPRTFIAATELKDLKSLIQTGKIPTEVCIANLIFWSVKTRPRYLDMYTTTDENVKHLILISHLNIVFKLSEL